MDYQPSNFGQTIPSRTTVVPSDHQLEYTAGQTIRFDVEKFLPFIDPRSCALKMRVKINAAVPCNLPRHAGAQNLLQNVRITDGQQLVNLETLQDYNRRVELMSAYSENPSVLAKRQLLEGVPTCRVEQMNQAIGANGRPAANQTSAQFHQATFSDAYATAADGGAAVNAATTPIGNVAHRNDNTIEVMLPLWSGILGTGSNTAGGGKVYPNLLTGLHLEVDLANSSEVLVNHSDAGLFARAAIGRDNRSCPFEILAVVGGGGAAPDPVTSITLKAQNLIPPALSGAALTPYPTVNALVDPDNNSVLVQNGMCGMSNWSVGSELQFSRPTNAPGDMTPVMEYLGTITSITPQNYNTNTPSILVTLANGYDPVSITRLASPADADGNGKVWLCDGWQTGDVNNNVLGATSVGAFPTQTGLYPRPSYTVSNVELLIKSCQPPKQYVDSLIRNSMSKAGVELDILTYQTNRNSVLANEQVSQIVLPTFLERATSALALPTTATDFTFPLADEKMVCVLDTIKEYAWFINNQSQPTRPVNCQRSNYGKYDQLKMWEDEKALTACRLPVRNLDLLATDNGGSDYNPVQKFTGKGNCFSRALAKFGGCYDLRSDGSIQLRTEYMAPVLNKLMITYIAHLRRIRISSEGVSADD